MSQPIDRQSERRQRLAALAAALAALDVDAAQFLGEALIHEAAARKRWIGCGILIRWDSIRERAELITGE